MPEIGSDGLIYSTCAALRYQYTTRCRAHRQSGVACRISDLAGRARWAVTGPASGSPWSLRSGAWRACSAIPMIPAYVTCLAAVLSIWTACV